MLLAKIAMRLPPRRKVQQYRLETLHEGPTDNNAANAIRACDLADPLNKSPFYVFSGTIATGQKVRIQGPHYTPGSKEDFNMRDPLVSYRETIAGTLRTL